MTVTMVQRCSRPGGAQCPYGAKLKHGNSKNKANRFFSALGHHLVTGSSGIPFFLQLLAPESSLIWVNVNISREVRLLPV